MNRATITIQGKKYKVCFTYGTFRLLGMYWKCRGITEVLTKIADTFGNLGDEPLSFEQEDALGDIIHAAISVAGGDAPDNDDIIGSFMEDPSGLKDIFELMNDSLMAMGNRIAPQAAGRPKAKKKTAAKKKK